MSDLESMELAHAKSRGPWGFRVPVVPLGGSNFATAAPFVSDSLLTVELPAWMARAWTITLGRFVYQGQPPNATITNAFPTDNQVFSNQRTRAQIDWGVDGSTESATLDYPAKGCTFSVIASNIRLKVFSELGFPGLASLPIYSGFMAPVSRAVQGGETWPMFTTAVTTIASGVGQHADVPIPARAAAYRVYEANAGLSSTGVLLVVQEDQSRNQLIVDQNFPSANYAEPENHAGYYPLVPNAQFIGFTNTEAAVHNVVVQFILDLG